MILLQPNPLIKMGASSNKTNQSAIPLDIFKGDALEVAPFLVGKWMCRKLPTGETLRGQITQTEAYRGEEDLACHARHGKTPRNAPLYEEGGICYVYLIYGIHWLCNVVTGKKDQPQGVMIRCLRPPLDGPGKWTKAFQIKGEHTGQLLMPENGIWLEDGGEKVDIITAPRVGIDYASPPWKEIPWRFILKE